MNRKNNKDNNICIENRKARHDYFIDETIECGIELRGNEVKSIRHGMASIKESWVDIVDNELIIKQMYITSWETSNKFDVDENRNRRLLVHKNEIISLNKDIKQQRYTIVPLKVYITDNGKVKVLIGVAKGKHNYDKRQTEKERQIQLDIRRSVR